MTKKNDHVEYQKQYFDSNYEFFCQPIPEEVDERTRMIVQSAGLDSKSRVLDVGTGMGVLIKHFLEEGVVQSSIVGCDLSTQMLNEAKRRFPDVEFWQGDFAEYSNTKTQFNAVFFNACFGNIFDQDRAVSVAAGLLAPGGVIIISHPLGNKFVGQLRDLDPQLVLTLLPEMTKLQTWCNELPLKLDLLRDEPDLYLAVLRKIDQ